MAVAIRIKARPRGAAGATATAPRPGERVLPKIHTPDGWAVDTIRWDLLPDYDYEKACEGLSEEGIRQELEIDWSATKGRRVYPQFGRSHHVSVQALRFNPRATVYCGWDFGGVPAFVITQLNAFNQWLIFPSLSPPDSVTLGVYEFGQMVADLLLREYASPAGLELNELKLVHFGDPAGAARPPRTGDRPRETQSCFEILNRGLILHAGEGLEGKERPDRRPGWGWKIRPGPVNITARLEAVRARLMLNLRDGLPALVVDPRANAVIEAFLGGYCYHQRADGQFDQDPHKNWASHTMDALGYVASRLFHQAKDEDEDEEGQRVEFRSHAASREDY